MQMSAALSSGMKMGPLEETPSLEGASFSHSADRALKAPESEFSRNQSGVGGRSDWADTAANRPHTRTSLNIVFNFCVRSGTGGVRALPALYIRPGPATRTHSRIERSLDTIGKTGFFPGAAEDSNYDNTVSGIQRGRI